MKTLIASTLIAIGLLSTAASAAPNTGPTTNLPTWAQQAFDSSADRQ